MKMVRILSALCLLAGSAATHAEPARGHLPERGSSLPSEQVQLPRANAQVRIGELVGARLENRHGDRIGQIDEVVVDLATKRLDFAVVRFDAGWLGTTKHAAVPARALLGRSVGASGWVLDTDPARAMSLPEFSPDKLARLDDAAVMDEVHRMLERSPWLRPPSSSLEN